MIYFDYKSNFINFALFRLKSLKSIPTIMKDKTYITVLLSILAIVIAGCSQGDEPGPYIGWLSKPECAPACKDWRDSVFHDSPLRQRHRDSMLKILAIGNSFTTNATTYMPWMIDRLNGDSICIAKLTRSGCSLKKHWTSHVDDTPDYELYYSNSGRWVKEELATIDEALTVMEWDIIIIQQNSGNSGIYSSYQPYLSYLIKLFYETNPNVKIAWHSTWPYRLGCEHNDFRFYDYDSLKMYKAILEAASVASEGMDFMIPATDLIWRMRQDYPEVEDGFSKDGYHISDPLALYALSTLWYEVLVRPYTGKSCMDNQIFPMEVDSDFLSRALSIVADLTDYDNYDLDSVGMVYAD